MSIVASIGDFFSRLSARKAEVEAKKAEPYEELIERVLAGDVVDDGKTLKILQDAGKTIEQLQAEVTFRLKLRDLDAIIAQGPELAEEQKAAETALELANEEHEKRVREHHKHVAAIKVAIFARIAVADRISRAQQERRELLLARHAGRAAELKREQQALNKQRALLRSALGDANTVAEAEQAMAQQQQAVDRLQSRLDEFAHRYPADKRWMLNDDTLAEMKRYRLELERAKEGLAMRIQKAQGGELAALRRIEVREVEIHAELKSFQISPGE